MNDNRETTNRELLKHAAQAAGLYIEYWGKDFPYVSDKRGTKFSWDPLSDDGEALRLAAHLRISVGYDCHVVGEWAVSQAPDEPDTVSVRQYVRVSGGGFAAAYRRAIVLAAAEMATERRD
jgi:hypothetical protein